MEGIPEDILVPKQAWEKEWKATYLPLVPSKTTTSSIGHPESYNITTLLDRMVLQIKINLNWKNDRFLSKLIPNLLKSQVMKKKTFELSCKTLLQIQFM